MATRNTSLNGTGNFMNLMLANFVIIIITSVLTLASLSTYLDSNNYFNRIQVGFDTLTNPKLPTDLFEVLSSSNQAFNLENSVVTAVNLNVRSSPSLKSSVVRVLPLGTIVKPLQISGDWVKVASNNWVSSAYLSKAKNFQLIERDLTFSRNGTDTKAKITFYRTDDGHFRARLRYESAHEDLIVMGRNVRDIRSLNAIEYERVSTDWKVRETGTFSIDLQKLIQGGNVRIGHFIRKKDSKRFELRSRQITPQNTPKTQHVQY